MASTQEFRRRIKSVNNTKQITKAMEMIASIKMQKSVKAIQQTRSYVQSAWHMLHKLATLTLPENHPLLKPGETNKVAIILLTSDRGLCASYNSDILKKFSSFMKEQLNNGAIEQSNFDIIAIGKKGAAFVKRNSLGNLIAEFHGLEADVQIENIVPISKMTNGEYLAGKYKKVVIVYSHFVSSLKQTPVVKQVLPVIEDHIDNPELWEKETDITENTDFKFEPSADAIVESILLQLIRSQIFGAVLESNASEQSARMVAMKSATDNAKNLIDELTLLYNSIRQDSITREIAEIAGAAEAMK